MSFGKLQTVSHVFLSALYHEGLIVTDGPNNQMVILAGFPSPISYLQSQLIHSPSHIQGY